jgi:dipeptidyl aminopeptidase/acylaminoacyl peptidase
MILRATLVAAFLAALPSHAQDVVTPPAALKLENVPPISAELARKLKPYGEFRPHGMLSWHPIRREMLVRRRLEATNQVHLVTVPGTTPQPVTDFPNAIQGAGYQPTHGEYFVYSMGEGGNEVFRLYRHDLETKSSTPLSPAGERAAGATFNRKGDRLAYTTALVDANNRERSAKTTLHIVDPLRPASDKVLGRFDGGGWGSFRFSEDGKRLAFIEYLSANESHVWVMDVATGKKRRLTKAAAGEPVAYSDPAFTRDGRGLLLKSDRGSEFRRIALMDVASGKERVLTGHLNYDVDDIAVSIEAGKAAFTTNENGSHVLRFLDLATLKELPRPPLFDGVIGGLAWRRNAPELAFHVVSARSAGDVFSYDFTSRRLTRWTNGNSTDINTSEFPEPIVVKWKSFDGREISGLLYQPPRRFEGRRPVIVNIHGGPEGQSRPTFIGRNNYFVTELGIAMIYPNVRGSTGFGKTFLKLDNGRNREDSVKDIGALFDWIGTQPSLDPARVMVMGGSYGGYMSLAVATLYPERIAGAIDVVGISNWVTFLNNTESYRRDLRRVEYGDERDPEMRAFLESISPLGRADRITKPLFVVQGRNDPRVPYTEAEQVVASLRRRGTPYWFMMAADEGHGFVKKPNADYLFYATVEFARRTLLDLSAMPAPLAGSPSGS